MIWIHATFTAVSIGCTVAFIWIISRTDKEVGGLLREVKRLQYELRETWAVKREPDEKS